MGASRSAPINQRLNLYKFISLSIWCFLLGLAIRGVAQAQATGLPAPQEWTVDGVKREAIVFAPATAKSQPSPVLFAFHGHTGTMKEMALRHFQEAWPEAIVVCPQGLKTPGRRADLEGKFTG